MRDARAGGTIYIWTLGADKSAHAIAREFGHADVLDLLLSRTPEGAKLGVATELEDEALVTELLARRIATVADTERGRLLAAARGNKTRAVQVMLRAGWPGGVPDQEARTPVP